jgi:integrase
VAQQHWNRERHTITILTKGNRLITLPVSPRLEELFSAAEPATHDQPFWLALRGRQHTTSERWNARYMVVLNAWSKHKKEHGLPENLTFHDLRRTLAVEAYTLHNDILDAQAALGHRQTATTLRYLAPLVKDQNKLRATLATIWIPKGGRPS